MSVRWQFYQNLIENFSFENESETITGLSELWTKVGTPTLSISSLYKKHNLYSQKIIGDASGEGISQIIDVSDIATSSFGLVFYAYIVTGTLRVQIETLDSGDIVLEEVLDETYSTNATMTKQLETFIASGTGYTQLKITISQSGGTAMTCYLDSVIIYEAVNTETEINPTQFSYQKVSDAQYQTTIEGDQVKITPLDSSKRTHLDGIAPVWAWLSIAQKNIFESLVGEEVVILTHNDDIFHCDIENISINYQEKQVPDMFAITMTLRDVRR